jgi:hypothetical protein
MIITVVSGFLALIPFLATVHAANSCGAFGDACDDTEPRRTTSSSFWPDRLAYRIWVEAPEQIGLQRGIERDGETDRRIWLAWMTEKAQSFADDETSARADLRVNGCPSIPHDPETEVVTLHASSWRTGAHHDA